MENNNFEKQVQEKLVDLQIQPSEKAWAGIESRIRKKDSPKRILWFLLIGLFLFAGGGYFFLMNGNGYNEKVSQVPKLNTETIIQKNGDAQGDSSDAIPGTNQVVLNGKKQLASKPTAMPDQVSSLSSTSSTSPQENSGKDLKNKNYPGGNKKMNLPADNQVALINSHEKSTETNAIIGFNESDKIKIIENSNAAIVAEKAEDTLCGSKKMVIDLLSQKKELSSQTKEDIVFKESTDINKMPTAGVNKNKSSSPKNWEIGITFSAAQAFLGNGLQLSRQDNSNVIYYDPGFNSPASRPGPSLGLIPIVTASSPENSVGFKAGIVLKKEISPKISFVTGLGYTYYTNSILIGNQLPAGNYSSIGMLSPYRNNFHFVDLPLSTQFHFNKNRKIPLNLAFGIQLSQLFASNAVQYKSGIYKVDNSVFTETQLGINAGLSATFFRILSVGPYYHYGLNPLGKEGLYGKKHLNFLGLKGEFIFRKNK